MQSLIDDRLLCKVFHFTYHVGWKLMELNLAVKTNNLENGRGVHHLSNIFWMQ